MKSRMLALAAIAAITAACAGRRKAAPAVSAPPPAAGDAARDAQQAYLEGVLEFQKGDYAAARKKWERALKDDPSSDDAKAGLERLDQLER